MNPFSEIQMPHLTVEQYGHQIADDIVAEMKCFWRFVIKTGISSSLLYDYSYIPQHYNTIFGYGVEFPRFFCKLNMLIIDDFFTFQK